MIIKCKVELTKEAKRDTSRIPIHVAVKLEYWINGVMKYGIEKMRKTLGFHDEALKEKEKASDL